MSKTALKISIALLAMLALSTAFAQDKVEGLDRSEWRVLGPAFSYHTSKAGAPIVRPIQKSTACTTSVINAQGLREVICIDSFTPAVHAWTQDNPAIGLERSWIYADHKDTAFGSIVKDSFGDVGFMAGVSRQWPIGSVGSIGGPVGQFDIYAGVSGGLWYRTVLGGVVPVGVLSGCTSGGSRCESGPIVYESQLKRRLVPFIFPVASVTHSSGLGLNLALAPKIRIGGYSSVPTTTLMVQLTYKLNF